ncbi:MAG: HTH-type transcriptional regulator YesS [Candidatus Dichloromethanomonas elyunquensis]|nr:MAG: HTH-type transcriptional regulator YesS [Candidatus Dichloromethanomonas elyunquensis]
MKYTPYYFGPDNIEILPLAPHEIHVSLDALDTTITLHRHNFIEILLFISGQGTHIINEQSYPIQPGSFSLVLPYHVHEIKSESEIPVIYYRCSFDHGLLLKKLDIRENFNEIINLIFSSPPVIQCSSEEQNTLENIYHSLINNREDSHFSSLFANEAFHLFLKYLRLQSKHKSEQAAEKHDAWKAIKYIYRHSGDDITLTSVAEQLNYSSSELNLEINSTLGINFTGLLNEVRIRNACSLLLAFPELSVSFISKTVGFQSDATFFRTFKKIWNLTPDKYRRQYLFRCIETTVKAIPTALKEQIVLYIFQNYTKDLNVEWLAKQFEVNEQRLNQEFQIYFGMSFPDYLSMIRINKAFSLLGATNISTGIIAKEIGFKSLRTFTRAFQKHAGMTPYAYRTIIRTETGHEDTPVL